MIDLSMACDLRRFTYISFVMLVVLAAPATGVCGDEDGFFEKGFAGEVLDQRDPESLPKQGNPKLPDPKKGKPTPKPSGSQNAFVEAEDPSDRDSIVPKIEDDDPTAIPILSIDAVINFTKIKHAVANAKFIATFSRERKVMFNRLYALGAKGPVLAALDPKTRIAFTTSVNRIVQSKKPPSDLPLKGSPSWIIYTNRGRYIAEGDDALERLTTMSGKLKWPKDVSTPVPMQADAGEDPVKRQERELAEQRIKELLGTLKNPPRTAVKKSKK